MTNLIKQMRKILGNDWCNQIHIHIGSEEIWLEIYETEIPLVINLNKKEVYVDNEYSKHHLDSDMLNELGQICKLLEDNLNIIEEILKWD